MKYDEKAKKTAEEKRETRRKMFEAGDSKAVWHFNRKYSYEETSFRGLYNRHEQSARSRKLSFNIPFEDFVSLTSSHCFWCKKEPFERYNTKESKNGYTQDTFKGNQRTEGWILYNGLDRIDTEVGYELGNVNPCCKWCNFARNTRTMDEFKNWICLISRAQENQ
jgi:hypothetical protein